MVVVVSQSHSVTSTCSPRDSACAHRGMASYGSGELVAASGTKEGLLTINFRPKSSRNAHDPWCISHNERSSHMHPAVLVGLVAAALGPTFLKRR